MSVLTPRRISISRGTFLVLAKDVRIELRTREIVTTAGFFAALVAILVSVTSYSGIAAHLEVDGQLLPWTGVPLPPNVTLRLAVQLAPGAIWLSIAFASVLALGRTWQREREEGAL